MDGRGGREQPRLAVVVSRRDMPSIRENVVDQGQMTPPFRFQRVQYALGQTRDALN